MSDKLKMMKYPLVLFILFVTNSIVFAKPSANPFENFMKSQRSFAEFHLKFIDAWVDMERQVQKESLGKKPNDKVIPKKTTEVPWITLIDTAHATNSSICYFGGWPSTINPINNECRRPWDEQAHAELSQDDRYKDLPTYGPSCERPGVIRCNPDIFGSDSVTGDYEGHCVSVEDEQTDWTDQCRDYANNHQCLFYERLMNDDALRERYFENVNRVVSYCRANDLYESSCQEMLGHAEDLNIHSFYCENNLSAEATEYFDVYNEAQALLQGNMLPIMPIIDTSQDTLATIDLYGVITNTPVNIPDEPSPEGVNSDLSQEETDFMEVAANYYERVEEIEAGLEDLYFTDSQGMKFPHYCNGILDSDIVANRSSWQSILHEYSLSPAVRRTVTRARSRAHSRTQGYCARYVKQAMQYGRLVRSYPNCVDAYLCEDELERSTHGMINLMETEDFTTAFGLTDEDSFCQWLENDAPVGTVVVSTNGRGRRRGCRSGNCMLPGHMEIKTRDDGRPGRRGWTSDFNQSSNLACNSTRRVVTGIFIKRPE